MNKNKIRKTLKRYVVSALIVTGLIVWVTLIWIILELKTDGYVLTQTSDTIISWLIIVLAYFKVNSWVKIKEDKDIGSDNNEMEG